MESPVFSKPSQGYQLVFCTSDGAKLCRHQFGGIADASNVDCPNCCRPLLVLLVLDATDPRLEIDSTTLVKLPILLCWTCNIAQDVFSYTVDKNGKIDIVVYAEGGCVDDFPYENYPQYFPERCFYLDYLPPSERMLIAAVNKDQQLWSSLPASLQYPKHQIGGEPLMIDGGGVTCPLCGEPMPLLGVLGDASGTTVGFTGNPFVQTVFHLCRSCSCVSVFQRCD